MKRNIPLNLLEAFQPVVDSHKSLVRQVRDPQIFYHIIDDDHDSNFYFKIIEQNNQSGTLLYLIEWMPRSKDHVVAYRVNKSIPGLIEAFNSWIGLISAYRKVSTIYDDPILNKNQERFEKRFEILDEDADTVSFDFEQQKFLDEYLTIAKAKLEHHKIDAKEDDAVQLDKLIKETEEIRAYLTKDTKRGVIKRLSRFWAGVQKIGLSILKDVLVDIVSETATKFIRGQ